MFKYLSKKTKDLSIINQVIRTLKTQGFINDSDFIDQFIASYLNKGQGPTKIHFNLLNKGIDKEEISLKLDKISDSEWLESAKVIVLKKKKDLDKLNKYKAKQKIYQLLTRQGHKYPTVKAIIDAYPHLE